MSRDGPCKVGEHGEEWPPRRQAGSGLGGLGTGQVFDTMGPTAASLRCD